MKTFQSALALTVAALFSPLLLVSGCGGNVLSSLGNPAPVSAQQQYSNASLTGTYSFSQRGTDENAQPFTGIGAVKLDGNGNLTGTFTDYYVGGLACQYSATGTYSLSSSASGTANVNATTTSSGCSGISVADAIQAGQQGQSILFTQSDGKGLNSGIALKQ